MFITKEMNVIWPQYYPRARAESNVKILANLYVHLLHAYNEVGQIRRSFQVCNPST